MPETDEIRPTVAVLTLGCKLNQADSERIARRLGKEGVRVVERPAPGARAVIINSCSVTHVADRKARHLARLARRLSPDAEIVLAGCYAETASAEDLTAAGVDLVLRREEKSVVVERVLERLASRGDPAGGCPAPVRDGLRTRAFIKIQEGCSEMCAFCVVPYTRGREVSVAIDQVVTEALSRQAEGVQEVVLTGTQLGNYGRDLGWEETGPRLLLEALLERTSLPRIRLSSLQAQDISPDLLYLWKDGRLCPHFHLPLQSGSDSALKRMRRRYTASQFLTAVEMIRERVPDVAITTDVIAGFPGETDEEFAETERVCRDAEFAGIHAFPYSRRPGTGAALMKPQSPPAIRRERLERLLAIGEESSRAYRNRLLGRSMPVLWEQTKDGAWQGLTGNYVRVYTAANAALSNRLVPARLLYLENEGVRGALEGN